MSTTERPEFSFIVPIEDLAGGAVNRRLKANETERSALAARFDILSVDSLSAAVTLNRLPASRLIRVEGRLVADVKQPCIVSFKPVADHIDAVFSEVFSPVGYQPRDEMEEDEIVDSFDDDGIDIGELVAQHLSLSLNPYPRAEGVELPGDLRDRPAPPDDRKPGPLAGLNELLRKRH